MRKIICIVLLAAVLLSPDLSAIQTLPTPVDGAAEAAADIVQGCPRRGEWVWQTHCLHM